MQLVVGVDAGGTASRAVVATLAGAVVGRGRAGPGNPFSAGPAAAVAIESALRQALAGSDPARVAAGVFGLAGTSACDDPAIAAALHRAWRSAGPPGAPRVVGDAVTAFAAGTPSASGAVLIAGTGAVAARIENHEIVRTADGFGWLLGDEGSGRWIGLQAVRAAVRAWPAPLSATVARHAGVDSRDALIAWAHALPLAEIAALAPLVCAAARAGDPDAAAVVARAVGRLLATLDSLGPAEPVVLAGSLLTADTPVRDGLLAALRERGVAARASRDPAAAAAWLAARPLAGADAARLHASLLPAATG